MKIFAKGFNYSQDGPGNRLVYHIAGCNMHCLWCSNPEGMHTSDDQKDYSNEMFVREAISCKPLFFNGGGVTFTGGEATLCHEELLSTMRMMKHNHIHTAIETNGTDKKLSELLPFIDYLIMDYKHYDNELHRKCTGIDNGTIRENLEYICKKGRQLHIRIPLINGINSDNPEAFADYFSGLNTANTVFEFLRYHEYGKAKWTEEYKIQNGFITGDTITKFEEAFAKYNLNLINT